MRFEDLTGSQREEIFKYLSGKDMQDVLNDSDDMTKIIVKKLSRVIEKKTRMNKRSEIVTYLTKSIDPEQCVLFLGTYDNFIQAVILNNITESEWQGIDKDGNIYYVYTDGTGKWVIGNNKVTSLYQMNKEYSDSELPNGSFINSKGEIYAEVFDRTLTKKISK